MLAEGALEGIQPEAALAVHVYNQWAVGTIAISEGPVMASADKLTLTVTGRSGHGASPHLAVDPVVASPRSSPPSRPWSAARRPRSTPPS